jgi:hypothetical protein
MTRAFVTYAHKVPPPLNFNYIIFVLFSYLQRSFAGGGSMGSLGGYWKALHEKFSADTYVRGAFLALSRTTKRQAQGPPLSTKNRFRINIIMFRMNFLDGDVLGVPWAFITLSINSEGVSQSPFVSTAYAPPPPPPTHTHTHTRMAAGATFYLSHAL